jgi:hypothetical protein
VGASSEVRRASPGSDVSDRIDRERHPRSQLECGEKAAPGDEQALGADAVAHGAGGRGGAQSDRERGDCPSDHLVAARGEREDDDSAANWRRVSPMSPVFRSRNLHQQ